MWLWQGRALSAELYALENLSPKEIGMSVDSAALSQVLAFSVELGKAVSSHTGKQNSTTKIQPNSSEKAVHKVEIDFRIYFYFCICA